jgi:glycosyltransferase involved in cell wall biosynthesis
MSNTLVGARICIVGGIFDKPESYRRYHSISPETVLSDGLRARGIDVSTMGHREFAPGGGFDLIHVHHLGRAAAAMACARRKARFVLTSHDGFLMNGVAAAWKHRIGDPVLLRSADAVIALSSVERDYMIRRCSVDRERVNVIPNGISDIFRPVRRPPSGAPYLLFVGQLKKFKGLDHLIAAMPRIRASHPEIVLKVVYQVDEMLPHCRAFAARLGVADAVAFLGPKPSGELAALYSNAEAVIVPSAAECLSSVVGEAMACGAVVIATDVGGVREQIDPLSGFLIPARGLDRLGEVACRVLDDPGRGAAMRKKALAKARDRFSVEEMIARHLRVYERVLEGCCAGPRLRDLPFRLGLAGALLVP